MMAGLACAVLAAAIQAADRSRAFWEFGAGDTPTYAVIAESIRTGNLGALRVVKLLWGLPYLAAVTSWAIGISDVASVVLVSLCASLAAVLLVRHLWGGWVAAYFAIVSWDWIVASTLGGTEPLFVALVLLAFACARRERWAWASVAAACSVTVRPVGALALLSVVATLIARRRWRLAVTACLIGAGVGLLYAVPLARARGDLWEPIRNYQRDWLGGRPLGLPFVALLQGARMATQPIQIIRPAAWIGFVLTAIVSFAISRSSRATAASRPVETTFAALYVAFMFSYHAAWWAWLEFPRFAIPILPFAWSAVEPALPKRRWLVWVAAPASGALTAAWLIGFHDVWDFLRAAW